MSVQKACVYREIFSMTQITMRPLYVVHFTESTETYIAVESRLVTQFDWLTHSLKKRSDDVTLF